MSISNNQAKAALSFLALLGIGGAVFSYKVSMDKKRMLDNNIL